MGYLLKNAEIKNVSGIEFFVRKSLVMLICGLLVLECNSE